MHEPFDPSKFVFEFPVWVLVHPGPDVADRFAGFYGPTGEKAVPLFANEDLVERFLGKKPHLDHYRLDCVAGPESLLELFDGIERKGYTHVVIYAGSEQAAFYRIGDLRSRCAGSGAP